jgi:hypothetical protein
MNVDEILEKKAVDAMWDLNHELAPGMAPTIIAMKFSVKLSVHVSLQCRTESLKATGTYLQIQSCAVSQKLSVVLRRRMRYTSVSVAQTQALRVHLSTGRFGGWEHLRTRMP